MKKRKGNKGRAGYYEIPFWKEWLEADPLKRHELVEKLPFFRMCLRMENKKFWKHSFATMLNGYFEDLESAAYIKFFIESKSNRKKAR